MATKLDPIIFGDKKNIDYTKFNIGSLIKAITFNLEEFGKKGVQGLPVKAKEITALVEYEKAAKRAKEPYLQAGVCKKDLVFVVRDKKNDKFEAMTMAVKDYTDIRGELAQSSAVVVNVEPDKTDTTIPANAAKQANRFGTGVQAQEDADFGGITGNVVLCAHGAPKVVPGRVIGAEFGEKNPQQIVDILIGSKDKDKRIGKDYSGIITLSGCFTAAGGPEADKQDDPFAKKVLDLLRSKGYDKLSVKGMPGPSVTRDSGEKAARHAMVTEDGAKALIPLLKQYEQAFAKLKAKYKGDEGQAKLDPLFAPLQSKWAKLYDDYTDVLNAQTEAAKEANRIEGLFGNFGIRVVRKQA